MKSAQLVVAVIVVGLSTASLAGCTSAPEPAPSREWSDRMSSLLNDPKGQGGGGGGLSVGSGTKSASGSVQLPDVPAGKYEVLAVCTGADSVHMAIASPDSPGRVLVSADIACGATLRLPVTITTTGLIFGATTTGNTGVTPQWYAMVATPGWEPQRTVYAN